MPWAGHSRQSRCPCPETLALQEVAPATVLINQTFKMRSVQVSSIISLQNIRDLKHPKLLNLYKILGRKQVHRLVTLVTCFLQQEIFQIFSSLMLKSDLARNSQMRSKNAFKRQKCYKRRRGRYYFNSFGRFQAFRSWHNAKNHNQM